ncbi:hypothetical protein ACGC1H_004466 [Rhizoctonia solani]
MVSWPRLERLMTFLCQRFDGLSSVLFRADKVAHVAAAPVIEPRAIDATICPIYIPFLAYYHIHTVLALTVTLVATCIRFYTWRNTCSTGAGYMRIIGATPRLGMNL